jgi:hypothetical protein
MAILDDVDMQDFADLGSDLLLKDTCNILRNDPIIDALGGSIDNWVTIASVLCALIDLGQKVPQQLVNAQQDTGIGYKQLYTPKGTDIRVDDQIVTGEISYNVLAPYGETSYQVFTSAVILAR